jgi:hypothetical protein
MKFAIKIIFLGTLTFCVLSKTFAQTIDKNEVFNPTTEQELLQKILNEIYHTYYSPIYMVNKTPVFTTLKVDVKRNGQIGDVSFSDNTSPMFADAYLRNKNILSFKTTFEKYALKKSLSNTSILVPISYQPNSPSKEKVFTYDEIESLRKFKGKPFLEQGVVLPMVIISVLSKNNM